MLFIIYLSLLEEVFVVLTTESLNNQKSKIEAGLLTKSK